MEKISYERHTYESVDDSLYLRLIPISKFDRKNVSGRS